LAAEVMVVTTTDWLLQARASGKDSDNSDVIQVGFCDTTVVY